MAVTFPVKLLEKLPTGSVPIFPDNQPLSCDAAATLDVLRALCVEASGRWVADPRGVRFLCGGKDFPPGITAGELHQRSAPSHLIVCVLPPLIPCGICQEQIGAAVHAKLEPCGHDFCLGCIKSWCTERQNTCPHCRERATGALCTSTGERAGFEQLDQAPEDEREDLVQLDENWVSDARVECFGRGCDNACKWRNGEFDRLSASEQLEKEAENCSIECDGCAQW
jgi:hypothetical protein